jgi:DNA-binding response OmpR family regulator
MSQRVLVVDDEPFILRSLSFVLQRAGFEVLQARDGDEALEALRDHHPQVCLLDVMMPRRSGYEVCEIVKGDPDLCDIHVIMLTAKGQEVARERGLAAGCDEYLTKPFSPSLIVEKVKAAFSAVAEAAADDDSPVAVPVAGDAAVGEEA